MLFRSRNASASPAFGKECAKPLHVTLTSIRLTVELLIFITYSSPLADGWRGEQFTFTLSPRTHRDNSESPSEFSPADNHYPTRRDRRSAEPTTASLRGLKHPPSSAPQDEASPLDDVAAGSVDGEPRPQLFPAGARDGNTGGTNEPQAHLLLRRRRSDGQTERAEQKSS